MHITTFSLTDSCKHALAQRVAPYLGKPLSTEDRQALATIVTEILPPEIMAQMKEYAQGRATAPVLIKNLPEKEKIPSYDEKRLQEFFLPTLSQALFEAINIPSKGSMSRTRTKREAPEEVFGIELHSDPWNFSQLGVLRNEEHAATRFFDFAELPNHLSPDMLTRIKIHADAVSPSIPLATFLKVYPTKYCNPVLDEDKTDMKAQMAFEDAMDAIAVDVDLQKGDLICWNNRAMFHHATHGNVQKSIPEGMNRWAVLTVSEQRR